MDKIYADLVINNMKKYSEVPKSLQENVKIILISYVGNNIITREQLDELLKK